MEVALALGPYDSGELEEQKPSNDVLFSIIKIGIGEGEAFFCYRHYSPETGTFISPDPIGFRGGDPNLYRYVVNNPINYIDPDGRVFQSLAIRFCIAAVALGIIDRLERGRQSHLCEQPKRDGVNKTNEEVKKCKEEIVGPIDILLDIELFPDTDPLTKDIRR